MTPGSSFRGIPQILRSERRMWNSPLFRGCSSFQSCLRCLLCSSIIICSFEVKTTRESEDFISRLLHSFVLVAKCSFSDISFNELSQIMKWSLAGSPVCKVVCAVCCALHSSSTFSKLRKDHERKPSSRFRRGYILF
jgi:hypothetical protein